MAAEAQDLSSTGKCKAAGTSLPRSWSSLLPSISTVETFLLRGELAGLPESHTIPVLPSPSSGTWDAGVSPSSVSMAISLALISRKDDACSLVPLQYLSASLGSTSDTLAAIISVGTSEYLYPLPWQLRL